MLLDKILELFMTYMHMRSSIQDACVCKLRMSRAGCASLQETGRGSLTDIEKVLSRREANAWMRFLDCLRLESCITQSPSSAQFSQDTAYVVLLFYVHGKHLRSCRDGQLI